MGLGEIQWKPHPGKYRIMESTSDPTWDYKTYFISKKKQNNAEQCKKIQMYNYFLYYII